MELAVVRPQGEVVLVGREGNGDIVFGYPFRARARRWAIPQKVSTDNQYKANATDPLSYEKARVQFRELRDLERS